MSENTLIENFKIVLSNAYKLSHKQFMDIYKERSESDFEAFDCEKDMEQHIRGLEFRRMGCELQLDKLKQSSIAAVEEVGHVKDLKTTDLAQQSSDDREYKAELWDIKFKIYNQRVKALKDVFKELHKKTYIAYGGVDVNHSNRVAKAKVHFNKAIEQNVQAKIAETLAVKH